LDADEFQPGRSHAVAMIKPVHAQAGAGSAFHRPFCPEGRAALGLRSETGCPEQNRPFLLVATIIASAMAFIDATVVTIALPALGRVSTPRFKPCNGLSTPMLFFLAR
jgi:hypothetical protein